MRAAHQIFVGRIVENGHLIAGLDAAARGQGSLFIIDGEPGIGKTRLAEEVSARARQRGALVLWSGASYAESESGYGRCQRLLGSRIDPGAAESSPQHSSTEIARILNNAQQLAEACYRRERVGNSRKSDIRVRDAVCALLRVASAKTMLVVFDDLKRSDESLLMTLRLLGRQLRNSHALVIVTSRDAETGSSRLRGDRLGEHAGDVRRIRLHGMQSSEIAAMARNATEEDVAPDLIEALHDATGGNPFLLRCLLERTDSVKRLLVQNQLVRSPSEISATLRVWIRTHLVALSNTARSTLTAASVIGREFDPGILANVTDSDHESVAQCLGEAARTGLVAESTSEPRRFRFVHGLVREVLYNDLSSGARAMLHRKTAVVLEERYEDRGIDSQVMTLASHFCEGLRVGPDERAVRYAICAAEEARKAGEFGQAACAYQMALAALPLAKPGYERSRCDLLLRLGDARTLGGDNQGARASFSQAAELAEHQGDGKMMARAVLRFSAPQWHGQARNDESIRLSERALALLRDPDSPSRAMLMARLASELSAVSGMRRRAEALSARAFEMALKLQDPGALLSVRIDRDLILSGPDAIEQRLDNAQEISWLADQTGNKLGAHLAQASRINCYTLRAQLAKADGEARSMALVANGTRLPSISWRLKCYAAYRSNISGRFTEAERLSRDCVDSAAQIIGADAEDMFWPAMIIPFHEQNRLHELAATATASVSRRPNAIARHAFLALINTRMGLRSRALADFEFVAAAMSEKVPHDSSFLACLAAHAEVCAAFGDPGQAVWLLTLLEPYAKLNANFEPLGSFGAIARCMGLLARLASRVEQAEHYFEEALRINRSMNAHPHVAYAEADYAELLLRRGSALDHERAAEFIRVAMQTANELGMNALAARLVRLQRWGAGAMPSERAKAPTHPRNSALAATRACQEPATNFGIAAKDDSCTMSADDGGPAPSNALSEQICPSGEAAVFRRLGDYWTISYRGKSLCLRHIKGLSCLAHLLRNPFVELNASELATIMDSRGVARAGYSEPRPVARVDRFSALGDAGPMLDQRAKADYRRRLVEIEEELAKAQSMNDPAAIAASEKERKFVLSELKRGVGLWGRDRMAASPAERARVSVTKRTREAVAKIAARHQDLGSHLAETVHTGRVCIYRPNTVSHVSWTSAAD